MRVPGGGSLSGVEVRMVMYCAPLLLGSWKSPLKVAPASSASSSPGWAAFSAAWRSAPAATLMMRPDPAGTSMALPQVTAAATGAGMGAGCASGEGDGTGEGEGEG